MNSNNFQYQFDAKLNDIIKQTIKIDSKYNVKFKNKFQKWSFNYNQSIYFLHFINHDQLF